MSQALFDFCDTPAGLPPTSIVIRDVGHSQGYASITNAAEATVRTILRIAAQLGEPVSPNSPGIYYYDSDGVLGQLEHDGLAFTGFKHTNLEDALHGRD